MEENSSDDDVEHFDIRNRVAVELNALKQLCNENNISEKEFSACLENVLGKKKAGSVRIGALVSLCLRCICGFLFVIFLLYFVISCHNPTNKFFSRYTQELVYPVMRLLRLCTLILLKNINAENYVHLYQESCLMQNPFYKEPYVDCWPCENVRFIIDLSHLKNSTEIYQQSGIPFIIKDVLEDDVSFAKLQNIFLNYKNLLKAGTLLFESHHEVSTIDEVFDKHPLEPRSFHDIHVKWSLNKVPAVQIIRKLFKRPYFIPSQTEVALQKFIFIDGTKGPPYDFPMTDFANVWLAQGSGSHLVVLLPSPQCKKTCSTVSVLLEKKDILYYNWQFWRAKSYSVNASEEIGVTFMGSFY